MDIYSSQFKSGLSAEEKACKQQSFGTFNNEKVRIFAYHSVKPAKKITAISKVIKDYIFINRERLL